MHRADPQRDRGNTDRSRARQSWPLPASIRERETPMDGSRTYGLLLPPMRLKLIVLIGVFLLLVTPATAGAFVETPKSLEEFNQHQAEEATRKAQEQKETKSGRRTKGHRRTQSRGRTRTKGC